MSAIEQNKKYEQYSVKCGEYKTKIEKELTKLCEDIIKAVNELVLKKGTPQSAESKTFYLKMIGDYYRYIAECVKGDKLAEVT